MTAALIKPRAARPYIRGKALEDKKAQTHAELRAWVMLEKFNRELLPMLESIAPAPRADDPHRELRAEFSHMTPANSGRAMAAKIIADTKAEQLDMAELERGIGEAVDADFMLEWPELDDVEFFKTGGFPNA